MITVTAVLIGVLTGLVAGIAGGGIVCVVDRRHRREFAEAVYARHDALHSTIGGNHEALTQSMEQLRKVKMYGPNGPCK